MIRSFFSDSVMTDEARSTSGETSRLVTGVLEFPLNYSCVTMYLHSKVEAGGVPAHVIACAVRVVYQ